MPQFVVEFATQEPIDYHIVDIGGGIDLQAKLVCTGAFTYSAAEERAQDEMLALAMPVFKDTVYFLSEMGLGYKGLPFFKSDLLSFMRQRLEQSWEQKGLVLEEVHVDSAELTEESENELREAMHAAETKEATGLPDFDQILSAGKENHAAPSAQEAWVCPACGCANVTKFCGECGTPRP